MSTHNQRPDTDPIAQLEALLHKPSTLKSSLSAWQTELESHLAASSPQQAQDTLQALRALVKANRQLFEQESQALFERLIQPSKKQHRQTKSYRDIHKL